MFPWSSIGWSFPLIVGCFFTGQVRMLSSIKNYTSSKKQVKIDKNWDPTPKIVFFNRTHQRLWDEPVLRNDRQIAHANASPACRARGPSNGPESEANCTNMLLLSLRVWLVDNRTDTLSRHLRKCLKTRRSSPEWDQVKRNMTSTCRDEKKRKRRNATNNEKQESECGLTKTASEMCNDTHAS